MAKNTATKPTPAPASIASGESEINILRATLAEREAEIERLTVALQSAPVSEPIRLGDSEFSAATLAKILANARSEAFRVLDKSATVSAIRYGAAKGGGKQMTVTEANFVPKTDAEKLAVRRFIAGYRLALTLQAK